MYLKLDKFEYHVTVSLVVAHFAYISEIFTNSSQNYKSNSLFI